MNFLNTFLLKCGLHDVANKNNKASDICRMGDFTGILVNTFVQ